MEILGNLIDKKNEKAFVGTLPYIEIGDIDVSSKKYSHKNKGAVAGAILVLKGDILVSRVRPTRGAITIVSDETASASNAFVRLRVNNKINYKYLYYVLNRKEFFSYLGTKETGVTYPSCTAADVYTYKINVPSLGQQIEVVRHLDDIYMAIENRKFQIQDFDKLINSKYVDMFGKIEHYVPLSTYIKSLSAGKSLAGESKCKNKVLKTGSVSYDKFDSSEIKNLPINYEPIQDHLVKKGDVIISRMNTLELVGAAGYVWAVPENVYLPDRLWRAELKSGVNPIFIWQTLIQGDLKRQIRERASGTSGTMKNLSKGTLLEITTKQVDTESQNEFSKFVENINQLKNNLQHDIYDLESLLRTKMHEYFD